jgi:monofunctional biosynthetic peptidoglycan transglycosylase
MTPSPSPQPAKSPKTGGLSTWRRRIFWILRWSFMALLAIPPLQALLLRWVDPPVTETMLARSVHNWRETGEWHLPDYRWVDLDELPRSVPTAVLSSEDRAFFAHHGFDVASIRRAWARYQTHSTGAVVGGSTVSQQVARNVFLWQHRSWVRKGLEAWYTIWLEVFVPKKRILEVYVNIAEMGPMTFGVQAAADHWFDKPASKLRMNEAALITGLLPDPREWTPKTPHVRRRAAWIERAPMNYPK